MGIIIYSNAIYGMEKVMDIKKLTEELKRDEGVVLHAYTDSLGFLTIGVGKLIDARKGGGISMEEAEYLLANDIKRVMNELDRRLSWFKTQPDGVQRGLCNLAFQIGVTGLLGFKTTLMHIASGNYKEAGRSARQSLWYKQTKDRAERTIALIEAGK